MDIVRLASPWVLALAVPAWAIVLYACLAAAGRRRQGARARAALACLAVGLLLLALAGPSVRVSRQGLCPVCLVDDVSGSMAAAGAPAGHAEALAPWAAALTGRGLGAGTGGTGLVEFEVLAGRAVAPGSAESRSLARAAEFPADLRPAAAPESPGTRIEQGLLQGAAALPDGQGILLLYTDGRETLGDAVAAAAGLAARGIQVHAIAPDLRPRDAAILSVGPAAEPASGRPVRMEVRVASTVPAEVRVTLDRPASGTTPAGRWERRVALDPGAPAALVFDDDAPLPDGRYRYTARVAQDGDG
ncbi:MAG: hypothetical protein IMZ66_12340, partial [Planctomycetes bacterium]|nr:hypothetical protein [Planctomycetota bacterium]